MFLAFQPHLYEQQRKVERQSSAKPISPSTTLLNAPSLSPSSSTSLSTFQTLDGKSQENVATSRTSPSSSLFSRRKDRKRSATQSSTGQISVLSKTSSVNGKAERKLLRGRSSRPSSSSSQLTRPASSGSGLDDGKSFNGRFFSVLPPIKTGGGFNAEPAMTKQNTFNSSEGKAIPLATTMHVSIPLTSPYEQFKNSPGSEPLSAGRPVALDGLGISHFLDAFPPPEEELLSANEVQDLSHYPLPIRLGLIRPGQIPRSARKKLYRPNQAFPLIEPAVEPFRKKTTPQYCHGYYLCTAPPAIKEEQNMTNAEFQSSGAPPLVRRDSSRRPTSRGRSMSDSGENRDLTRKASTRGQSQNNEQSRRWKLEQYFRSYQTKTCTGTKSYKFHAYDREEACYWWGYSVNTLIAETLNHNLVSAIAGLTVLDWSKGPPSRVLDIGTGAGAWVVDLAKEWTETEFIGLDLVPIQTPLNHLPDEDLQSRISWVVANALQGLPFPDNSFDYVHIRKINIGIPEEKWGIILSEAIRVLTPNGNLEILETDWTFMGSPKEILTSDLQELLQKKGRNNQSKMKMWKRKDSRKYENLGMAVNQMLKVRMVKFDPASAIPFHLMSLQVHQFSQGQPRHFPILARSSTYQPDGKGDENNKGVSWSPRGPSGAMSFTMRPQIGLSLPPHRFQVDSQDMYRMAILVSDVTRISEARDIIWEDLQKSQKRNVLSNNEEEEEEEEGEDVVINKNNNDNVVGPWKNKAEFNREMDEWYTDLINRADLESLLKSTCDWDEAASRMDNRIQLDLQERRKTREKTFTGNRDFASSDSVSPGSTVTPLPDLRRHSETSDGYEDEDQSTVHEHLPTPLQFSPTTPILAFRTTTVFAAKKKP